MASLLDSEQTSILLDDVARGVPTALDQLLALHRPFLTRLVKMRFDPSIAARIDSSDVVQETQIVVARRIQEFLSRRDTSFRMWIRHTALERLMDQRRRHAVAAKRSVRREQSPGDPPFAAMIDHRSTDTPSRIARRTETRDAVLRLIATLATNDREILTLRYSEGLTNIQAAEILKIDPNTARQRHGRALRSLHGRLTANSIGLDESPE